MFGQGLVATAIATTWVTWRRACGETSPGRRWALAIVPATTARAHVKPLKQQFPVFPYAFGGEYGDGAVSVARWTAVGLLAGVFLILVLTREWRPWQRIANRPAGADPLIPGRQPMRALRTRPRHRERLRGGLLISAEKSRPDSEFMT